MQASLPQLIIDLIKPLVPEVTTNSVSYNLTAITLLVAVAVCVHFLGRALVLRPFHLWVKKTRNAWDDVLLEKRFAERLVHLLPALAIYLITPLLLDPELLLSTVITKLSVLYLLFSLLLSAYSLLDSVAAIYQLSPLSRHAPITGFIQVAKLALTIIITILSVSLLLDKNPFLIVSGLTALAAVLLLIFKDTILGLVAGIQIAANRMFNNGDWIQVDKFGVDGEILEIGLTNVKVQNWDKTISTLPTYALTNDAIKNWRGMQESGGRRIKRAFYIDINSVKMCDAALLTKFSKIRYINQYINNKIADLQRYHQDLSIDEQDLLNARKLTNLGTFRAYLEAYLRHHPSINQDMTLMVRQLPSSQYGIPLEVYCFSADKNWINYEGIQADIFDHIFAMLPQFELRAYQRDNFTNAISLPETKKHL